MARLAIFKARKLFRKKILTKFRWNHFDLTTVLKLEIVQCTILMMLQNINIKIIKMTL